MSEWTWLGRDWAGPMFVPCRDPPLWKVQPCRHRSWVEWLINDQVMKYQAEKALEQVLEPSQPHLIVPPFPVSLFLANVDSFDFGVTPNPGVGDWVLRVCESVWAAGSPLTFGRPAEGPTGNFLRCFWLILGALGGRTGCIKLIGGCPPLQPSGLCLTRWLPTFMSAMLCSVYTHAWQQMLLSCEFSQFSAPHEQAH